MLVAHALTLADARSSVAALADRARTFEATVEYERVLLQLDFIHGGGSPALDTAGVAADDLAHLFEVASASIEKLGTHGVDGLQIELALDMLEVARDKDLA